MAVAGGILERHDPADRSINAEPLPFHRLTDQRSRVGHLIDQELDPANIGATSFTCGSAHDAATLRRFGLIHIRAPGFGGGQLLFELATPICRPGQQRSAGAFVG